MNKYTILFCSLLIASMAACKKSDNRQYSTWHILGKRDFSTNKVATYYYPQSYKIGFYCEDQSLGGVSFSFDFPKYYQGSSLPQSGDYKLVPDPQVTKDVGIYFWYNNVEYSSSPTNPKTITAQSYNAKAKYVLDTTWFYNSTNPNDSVQIYGTFLEP